MITENITEVDGGLVPSSCLVEHGTRHDIIGSISSSRLSSISASLMKDICNSVANENFEKVPDFLKMYPRFDNKIHDKKL